MKNKQKLFTVYCIFALIISANALSAKTEKYSFDVFLWGIKVGELVYSIKKASNEYDISGVLRSKVLLELLLSIDLKPRHRGGSLNRGIIPLRTVKNQIQVAEKNKNL